MNKKKKQQLERERKMVLEGLKRQEKYAKMNDLTKCGYCSPQFAMFSKHKNSKVFKKRRVIKGKIADVKIYGVSRE